MVMAVVRLLMLLVALPGEQTLFHSVMMAIMEESFMSMMMDIILGIGSGALYLIGAAVRVLKLILTL